MVIPVGIYLIERLLRVYMEKVHSSTQMVLHSAHVLPGDIVHLVMKPKKANFRFRFHPGQYLYLNVE